MFCPSFPILVICDFSPFWEVERRYYWWVAYLEVCYFIGLFKELALVSLVFLIFMFSVLPASV